MIVFFIVLVSDLRENRGVSMVCRIWGDMVVGFVLGVSLERMVKLSFCFWGVYGYWVGL